jgi:hypothetical protein
MRLPKKIPRGATLRLEFVTCGRCPTQHGPYWYAYWKDYRGVTRKQYIGKQLPDGVQPGAVSPPEHTSSQRTHRQHCCLTRELVYIW